MTTTIPRQIRITDELGTSGPMTVDVREVRYALEAWYPENVEGAEQALSAVSAFADAVQHGDLAEAERWAPGLGITFEIAERAASPEGGEIVTSAPTDDGGWQVVERLAFTDWRQWGLATELSAADLGCEPGTVYRVELVAPDGLVVGTREIIAR